MEIKVLKYVTLTMTGNIFGQILRIKIIVISPYFHNCYINMFMSLNNCMQSV